MTMNFGLDREIDEQPKDLVDIQYVQGTGSGYPGRRNNNNYDPLLQAGTAFQNSDFFQTYRGSEPTNAVDANHLLYATSDQQPVMPMEITGAVIFQAKIAAHKFYKTGEEFTTDHLDPRLPESQANLRPQSSIAGLMDSDLMTDKLFKDLNFMTNPGTMNSQGEGTVGAPATGKESAQRLFLHDY